MILLYTLVIWIALTLISWAWLRFNTLRFAKLVSEDDFMNKVSSNCQPIDVRSHSEFKRSHIPGARHIAEQNFYQGHSGLRRDADILLYDQDGRSAVRVAKQLKKDGYSKDQLFILKGGFVQYHGKKTFVEKDNK